MKKWICAALILVMLLAFCGCRRASDLNNRPTYDETPPTDYEYAGDAEFWSDYEKSENLPLWYQVSGKDIYMDVPDWGNFQEFSKTDMFQNKDMFLTITSVDYVNFETPETIRQGLYSWLQSDVKHLINMTQITLIEAETVSIHGIDFYKAVCGAMTKEGTVQELYSYSFVLDGIAVNICGLPRAEFPDDLTLEQVDSILLEIVKSVRNTYEWNFVES